MKLGVWGLAFSTPTPVVQRAMFWCSRQSIDLISHSVKILIHPALNYIDISFYFPIKRYESHLMEPPFFFSCLWRLWLNHEFGGFWFQGETFLSAIFVKLGKQIPFHVYVPMMSFPILSLSHVTHFCLATVKTCHWKWGILSQTVLALFYRFTMAPSKGFRMPPFNHVHVLSEIVN